MEKTNLNFVRTPGVSKSVDGNQLKIDSYKTSVTDFQTSRRRLLEIVPLWTVNLEGQLVAVVAG